MVKNPHLESVRAARHLVPNAAHADNSQYSVMHVWPGELASATSLPLPMHADTVLGLIQTGGRSPSAAQRRGRRSFRSGRPECFRPRCRAAYRPTVDIVVAHGHLADHAESAPARARLHRCGRSAGKAARRNRQYAPRVPKAGGGPSPGQTSISATARAIRRASSGNCRVMKALILASNTGQCPRHTARAPITAVDAPSARPAAYKRVRCQWR